MPFVLRAPGVPAVRRSEPVSHLDVMPTLLEAAGIPAPEGLRGIALGPALRSGEPLPGRLVYCDMGFEVSAYDARGFVRLVNVGPSRLDTDSLPTTLSSDKPLVPGRSTEGPVEQRAWRYSWQPGGPAEALSSEGGVDQRVLEYLSRPAKPPSFGELSEVERKLLRALGY